MYVCVCVCARPDVCICIAWNSWFGVCFLSRAAPFQRAGSQEIDTPAQKLKEIFRNIQDTKNAVIMFLIFQPVQKKIQETEILF